MKLSRNFSGKASARDGVKSGFTMTECVVAILVINLTIVGMFRLLKSQEVQVMESEKWLEGNPVLYLNQDPDPLARALGRPALLEAMPVSNFWQVETLPFEVVLLTHNIELNPSRLQVVFEQLPVEKRKGKVQP